MTYTLKFFSKMILFLYTLKFLLGLPINILFFQHIVITFRQIANVRQILLIESYSHKIYVNA